MSNDSPHAAEKLIIVLEALSSRGGKWGVTELARRSGLPKSTIHRLLQTLCKHRLVEHTDGKYRLAIRRLELSEFVSMRRPAKIRVLLQPWLQDLYNLTHEVVHLNILCGAFVVCAEKLCGHDSVTLALNLVEQTHAVNTVSGKLLLAHSTQSVLAGGPVAGAGPRQSDDSVRRLRQDLTTIRQRGIATGRETSDEAVYTVAAPVLNDNGRAIAAISVSGPADRTDPRRVIPCVRSAARAASNSVELARASGIW